MKIETEEFGLEYNNLSELSYYDSKSSYIDLFKGDEFIAYLEVYCDSENDSREYICINYEIIYLDTLNKI